MTIQLAKRIRAAEAEGEVRISANDAPTAGRDSRDMGRNDQRLAYGFVERIRNHRCRSGKASVS